MCQHKIVYGKSGTEPLGGTSSRCQPMTSYFKRIRNMDKQLPEFCLTFGGISTGTQTHHYVQDYKRSSSWNIDHGSVETQTCTQTPIASRSFIVVYQSYFQNFLNLFSTRPRKKKYRGKNGIPVIPADVSSKFSKICKFRQSAEKLHVGKSSKF